jgi:hypothetical protein
MMEEIISLLNLSDEIPDLQKKLINFTAFYFVKYVFECRFGCGVFVKQINSRAKELLHVTNTKCVYQLYKDFFLPCLRMGTPPTFVEFCSAFWTNMEMIKEELVQWLGDSTHLLSTAYFVQWYERIHQRTLNKKEIMLIDQTLVEDLLSNLNSDYNAIKKILLSIQMEYLPQPKRYQYPKYYKFIKTRQKFLFEDPQQINFLMLLFWITKHLKVLWAVDSLNTIGQIRSALENKNLILFMNLINENLIPEKFESLKNKINVLPLFSKQIL